MTCHRPSSQGTRPAPQVSSPAPCALTPGHSSTAQLSGDPSFRPDPENFDLLEQNYETLGTGTSGLPAYRETHPQFPGLYCISRVPLADDSITRSWKVTWAGFLSGASEKGKANHINTEFSGDDITIQPVFPTPGPTKVSLPQLTWTVRYISLTPPATENVGLGNHLNSPGLSPVEQPRGSPPSPPGNPWSDLANPTRVAPWGWSLETREFPAPEDPNGPWLVTDTWQYRQPLEYS